MADLRCAAGYPRDKRPVIRTWSFVDVHRRPRALLVTGVPGRHRRQRVTGDVRRPQAVEGDEVAIVPVDAGDAVILVPAGAIIGGDLLRHGLVLARPRDDPAGVVAVIDLRV